MSDSPLPFLAPSPGIIKRKFLMDKKHTGKIGNVLIAYDPDNKAGGFLNMEDPKPCWILFTPISKSDFDKKVLKVTQCHSVGMEWSETENLKGVLLH